MAAQVGGYFGGLFNDQWGVTQGGCSTHMIFNVVVDVVLHHWVSVVEESKR